MLEGLNLEALGVSGITIAILLYQNWVLRLDGLKREEDQREDLTRMLAVLRDLERALLTGKSSA